MSAMSRSEFDRLERVPSPDRPGRYAAVVDGEVFTLVASTTNGELTWVWDDMPDLTESVWTQTWPCARLE